MKVWYIVVSAAPDHLSAKPVGKAGFEVDALSVACEISDDELGASNLGQYAVGDSLVRGCLTDPKWHVGARADCLVGCVSELGVELIREPASDKTASGFATGARF